MSALEGRKERDVIPRWRRFGVTVRMGEVRPLGDGGPPKEWPLDGLNEAVRAFETSPGFSTAGDVLSHAVVLGLRNEHGEAAANLILDSPDQTGRLLGDIARRYLADEISHSTLIDSGPLFNEREFRERVGFMRAILRREPRNSIRWADLALSYVGLGQMEQAERAIGIALNLAPHNRYVVRSAVRLYLLLDRADKARGILTLPDILRDPWIHASELTVSEILDRSPRGIKAAREAIEENRFAPWHLSELASELATIDLRAGKDRQAKRLLRFALLNPTENSQAQASWAIREHNVNIAIEEPEDLPLSNESKARWFEVNGDYEAALEEARAWQIDQPFDPAPALFGSYIAAVALDRHEDAADFAAQGLIANPGNAMLHNNLAFALGSVGRVEEAVQQVRRMGPAEDAAGEATMDATRGFVLFRSGDPVAGRVYYRSAVNAFAKQNDSERGVLASLLWAREEILADTQEAPDVLATALAIATRTEWPIARLWVDRVLSRGQVGRNRRDPD